ncbi:ComEC/Rec2 family competence protein [Nocardia sp. NPDC050697]|uniref:ComEC/Rec2 family competence protein n=1 Tax=Nocardia sp. NPDC050697 TaxID=3155158 RepID=UPI0033DC5807
MSGQRPPGDPVTTLSGYWPIVRPEEPPTPEPRALDARLVPAALLCWAATIIAITAGWIAGLVLAALLVGTACALWIWLLRSGVRRSEPRRVLVWGMVAALLLGTGFATAAAWREQRVSAHPLRTLPDRASVQVYAVPKDDPKPVRGRSFGDRPRWVVRADLVEYRHAGKRVRAGGTVTILAGGAEWGGITPGGLLRFQARPIRPQTSDLTVAVLRANAPPVVLEQPPWWQRAAMPVRESLTEAARRVLGRDAAGVLPALVLGDTSGLTDDVREDFATAGLQHLCVVSGANVTIVLTAVLALCRALTVPPTACAGAAALALLLFVVIARPDPSVLRAAAMGSVTVLALLTGRRRQALPALCGAVIALLAIWPALAVSIGFALSVLATAALILIAPGWAATLRARGWRRAPAEITAVSAAAFAVTAPLVVAVTGKLSLVAVLANVLVAPVIAVITVLGALAATIAWAWALPAELLLRPAAVPLWWLLEVAEHTARLPGATVTVPGGPLTGTLSAAALLGTCLGLHVRAVRRRSRAGAALPARPSRPPPPVSPVRSERRL